MSDSRGFGRLTSGREASHPIPFPLDIGEAWSQPNRRNALEALLRSGMSATPDSDNASVVAAAALEPPPLSPPSPITPPDETPKAIDDAFAQREEDLPSSPAAMSTSSSSRDVLPTFSLLSQMQYIGDISGYDHKYSVSCLTGLWMSPQVTTLRVAEYGGGIFILFTGTCNRFSDVETRMIEKLCFGGTILM